MRLPPSIEVAWGARTPPNRGPKRGLSLDEIVAAGVAVADRDGLDAVSMKRVAANLGAGTMALYRYVGAKDELLALMVDAALGEPPEITVAAHDWRAGLKRWGDNQRAAYLRHPWVPVVPITGPPITPNMVSWMGQALTYLAATGLPVEEHPSLLLMLSGYVRSQTLTQLQIATAAESSGTDVGSMTSGYGSVLASVIDPDRFPALQSVIDSGVFDDDADDLDEDFDFDFGLERILDGIEAYIAASA